MSWPRRGWNIRRVVVSVGVVSFLGSAAMLLYGSMLVDPQGDGRDSYARGAVGHRAFVETLEALGYQVRRSRDGYFNVVREPMLFVDPSRLNARVGDERHGLAAVIDKRVERGLTSIVVLSQWQLAAGAASEHVLTPVGEDQAQAVLDAALGESAARVQRSGEPAGPFERLEVAGALGDYALELNWPQTVAVEQEGLEVLAGDAEAAHVLSGRGGHVIVVADPGLVQNMSFHRGQHASLWHALLSERVGSGRLAIDEVFHGHGQQPSLGTALGRFPAVLLVVHGLALGLLILMAGGLRFGPAEVRAAAYGRGAGEAVRVTASVLVAGCSLRTLVLRYVEQIILDLSGRLRLAESGTMDQRARALDQLARQRGLSIRASALLGEARQGRIERAGDALALARQAFGLYALERWPRRSAEPSQTSEQESG